MKQLIFAIGLLAFVSCKDSKTTENNMKQTVDATDDHDHDHDMSDVYANAWTHEIKLDNGRKWEANVESNDGVAKMQSIIETTETNTLEDYYKLTEELNIAKNFVIKNCTMKGESHDNLHVWLLPLIDKLNALSDAKTLEEAAKLKQSIKDNVNAYSDYFE